MAAPFDIAHALSLCSPCFSQHGAQLGLQQLRASAAATDKARQVAGVRHRASRAVNLVAAVAQAGAQLVEALRKQAALVARADLAKLERERSNRRVSTRRDTELFPKKSLYTHLLINLLRGCEKAMGGDPLLSLQCHGALHASIVRVCL